MWQVGVVAAAAYNQHMGASCRTGGGGIGGSRGVTEQLRRICGNPICTPDLDGNTPCGRGPALPTSTGIEDAGPPSLLSSSLLSNCHAKDAFGCFLAATEARERRVPSGSV